MRLDKVIVFLISTFTYFHLFSTFIYQNITTRILCTCVGTHPRMYTNKNNQYSSIIAYETHLENKDILSKVLHHIYKNNELKEIDLWFICLRPSNKESIMTGIINEFQLYLIYIFCFRELFLDYLVLINVKQEYLLLNYHKNKMTNY